MKKIGVIGDKSSVLCFMAAGFRVFVTEDPLEAASFIKKAASEDIAVLYVTEPLLEKLTDLYETVKVDPTLALIPIPAKSGSTGFALAAVKKSVERAVGADILK